MQTLGAKWNRYCNRQTMRRRPVLKIVCRRKMDSAAGESNTKVPDGSSPRSKRAGILFNVRAHLLHSVARKRNHKDASDTGQVLDAQSSTIGIHTLPSNRKAKAESCSVLAMLRKWVEHLLCVT